MKEQLITFETAKLAKEKGFNINNNYLGYCISNLWDYKEGNEICLITESENLIYQEDIDKICFKPTQTLLQKWLREEHKIDIRVDGDSTGTRDYRSAVKKDGEFKGRWSNASRLVIKYEVALEKALVKALKLI